MRDHAAADVDAALSAWRALTADQPGLRADAIGLAASFGRLDTAFDWFAEKLRPYVEPGNAPMPATPWLFGAPVAPMRVDPRFAQWCARIGFAAYWQVSRTRPDYAVIGTEK